MRPRQSGQSVDKTGTVFLTIPSFKLLFFITNELSPFVRKTIIKHDVDVFQKHQLIWILAVEFSLSFPLCRSPDPTLLFTPQGRCTSWVLIHLKPEKLLYWRGSIPFWSVNVTRTTTFHLNSNGSTCLRLEHWSSSLHLRLAYAVTEQYPDAFPSTSTELGSSFNSRRAQWYHILTKTF